jgi:PleD family two-component response regulator
MAMVLVVDDDESTCDALQRLLSRMGYAARCARSGRDALDVAEAARPDVIVLDWMMPEMDGLEVLRRLRATPATKDVPVLLYSAVDNPELMGEATRLGAQDCVLKSGGFYPLYERIERYTS